MKTNIEQVVLPCGCHQIRSDGTLWSLWSQRSESGTQGIITEKTQHWNKLSTAKAASGYFQFSLHGRMVRINRLVALSFVPNPKAYPEVQHKNGNRTDNRAENLKWGSQLHNAMDRQTHGNTRRGSMCSGAKLDEARVGQIKALRLQGETLLSIARKFSVSKRTVQLINKGKTWKHVK